MPSAVATTPVSATGRAGPAAGGAAGITCLTPSSARMRRGRVTELGRTIAGDKTEVMTEPKLTLLEQWTPLEDRPLLAAVALLQGVEEY